jgi:chromosome segregation ATPase
MWPKVLMQLIELLPHATRLIPVADRYFASKQANEKANEAALVAMAEGVQADLGQVTAAHAGLYRKMQEQEAQIAEMREELRHAKLTLDQYANRLEIADHRLASLSLWVRIGMSASVLMLIVILGLLLSK